MLEHLDFTDCLCTFTVDHETYVIIQPDRPGAIFCGRLQWDLWHGYRYDDDFPPKHIRKIADRLLALSDTSPGKYPLHREHYQITVITEDETVRYRIRREKTLFAEISRQTLSLFVQFCVMIVLSLFISGFFMDMGISWFSSWFPKASEFTAFCFYFGIEIIGSILLFLCFKQDRDLISLYLYAYIPIGLMILTGILLRWQWGWLILAGIVILFVLCLLHILWIKKQPIIRKNVIETNLHHLKAGMIILSVIAIGAMSFFHIYPYTYAGEEADIGTDHTVLQAKYDEACLMLEYDRFCTLDDEERIEVLQTICDYECIVGFGCNSAKVVTTYIKDRTTLGYYTDSDQTITIDLVILRRDDPEQIVNTLLHETRHHYQHRVIDLYQAVRNQLDENNRNMAPFRDAKAFLINFQDYQDNEKDGYDAYYGQLVEQDSRAFAKKRMDEYYLSFINQ